MSVESTAIEREHTVVCREAIFAWMYGGRITKAMATQFLTRLVRDVSDKHLLFMFLMLECVPDTHLIAYGEHVLPLRLARDVLQAEYTRRMLYKFTVAPVGLGMPDCFADDGCDA